MSLRIRPLTGTTHTLPFDKLSPRDFERLCLWLVEREGYERAEHLGAAGSEQGRDIVVCRKDEKREPFYQTQVTSVQALMMRITGEDRCVDAQGRGRNQPVVQLGDDI